jgi:short-subunit dehydrogenase
MKGKDVGILVNNVGMTENTFGWFSDLGSRDGRHLSEEEHVADLIKTIKTNCIFPSKLTAAIIPLLKSRDHKYSAIVNVSSILAHLPSPYNPIYGASKAYNRTFSRALTAEYAQMGIDVLCVSPGMVTSNLTGMKRSTWFCSGSRETAMYALRTVGFAVEVFPHPIHGLTYICVAILNLLPQKFVTSSTALLLRFLPKPPGINVSRDFRKY